MRALHIVGDLDPQAGGNTAAAVHTCGYLREAGVEAELAGTWREPRQADYIKEMWPNLPIYGFARTVPRHYWNSPDLRRWVTAHVATYDLVVIHGVFNFPFTDTARLARAQSVPYVVQPHSSLDPHDLKKHRLLKMVYGPVMVRRLLRGASAVMVTTSREAARLVDYGAGVTASVVPLPLPPRERGADPSRFRQRYAIPSDATVVLSLSRLDPKKAIERALHAALELSQTFPDFRLVIAGGAEDRRYERRLKGLADQLGLGPNVVWTGMLLGESKWDAFAAADVFVLPSNYENFGITVIESLQSGTPVVISNEVYLADHLIGSRAVYVCGTDVPTLVTSLREAIQARAREGGTIADAARMAAQDFAPSQVIPATLAVYNAAVARARH